MAKRTAKKPQQNTKKPGAKARPPHPGEAERIAARRVKAMELRKAGHSFRAIGTALQVNASTVCRDIADEMAELKTLTGQAAEDTRQLELERLDRLWTKLEAHGLKRGDYRAVLAAVRISERRAKLLGLDAPTKLAGPTGGPIEHAVLYIPDNFRKSTA